jgi:hypothetical protein
MRCADNHVHERGFLADFVRAELRHAATHADDHLRLAQLELAQVSQRAEHLVFGLAPHRAGVEQHDIGVLHPLGRLVALLLQVEAHLLGVFLVHLAAPSENLVARHSQFTQRRLYLTRGWQGKIKPLTPQLG